MNTLIQHSLVGSPKVNPTLCGQSYNKMGLEVIPIPKTSKNIMTVRN